MDIVRDFLTKNLRLKLTSIILAVFLWFLGMNINNPTTTQTFVVPLVLRGTETLEEDEIILLNEEDLVDETIEVRIRGRRNDLQDLERNPSASIKPYIDFTPVDITSEKNIGTIVYMSVYKPTLNTKYEVLDTFPRSVEVEMDKIVVVKKPLEVEIEGSTSTDYVLTGDSTVVPEEISFEGASTLIDTISRVVVYTDVSERSSSYSEIGDIVVLDVNGEDISDKFTLETDQAEINVSILKQKDILINKAEVYGEPQSGYKVRDIKYSTEYIHVVGDESELEQITSINLDPIIITNKTDDFIITNDLERILKDVNENLSIRNGTDKLLNIEIDIDEYITKDFVIPKSSLAIRGDVDNLEIADSFTVTVEGFKDEIDVLTEESFSPSLDVRNVSSGMGSMDMHVSVSMPEGATLINEPTIKVTYIEEEVTEETVDNDNNTETEVIE
ncbi:MAG: YbbR-like domain-containing protein [Lachnospirales bacterium]